MLAGSYLPALGHRRKDPIANPKRPSSPQSEKNFLTCFIDSAICAARVNCYLLISGMALPSLAVLQQRQAAATEDVGDIRS